MQKIMRSRLAIGAAGLLLAAVLSAGGAVAATVARDAGSLGAGDAESADAARAGTTSVVSRRIVVNNVAPAGVKLLTIPGLGELKAACASGDTDASVRWNNTTGAPVDVWMNYADDGQTRPFIASAGATNVFVTYWDPANVYQIGGQLDLGQGNSPGPRRTATVSIHAYRSTSGAPCGFQATATTWSTP